MSRAHAAWPALALALAACTAPDPCRDLGAHQALVATLLFGRTPEADAAWPGFLATVITPRFPDGLTVIEASGQWRDPRSGTIGAEPSRVVVLATEDATRIRARLDEIAAEYKARFHQQSVGILVAPSCARF